MSSNWLVVALSVGSALSYSVSTNLKKVSATQVPDVGQAHTGGVLGFVWRTLKHPLWLASILADCLGLGLQIVALHLGALALVQPLLVTSLLFALLLRQGRARRFSRHEALWVGVLTCCLVGFLALSGFISGSQQVSDADRLPAVIAALAGLFTAGLCLALARRRVPPATRAALIGIVVGVIYAATAALIKTSTNVLTMHGVIGLLSAWQLYVTIALGAAGLFLTQVAFQAGPLAASLPAISTVDPLASVAIGVLVYDEHLRRGPLGGVLLLGLLVLLTLSVLGLGRVEQAAVESVPAMPDRTPSPS
jgi:drug/metabolite transporter (DMT)-like permease